MIIFLYGADTFRSWRFRQDLQEKFKRDVDPSAISISVIDGQTATLSDVANLLGAGSLFVKKRLVVITGFLQNKKEKIFPELTSYLQKLSKQTSQEENVIIFHDSEIGTLKAAPKKFLTFLLKQRFVQEFKPLTGGQTISFIKQEAASYGKKIESGAANELANRTNNDSWLIASSVKKLSFINHENEISLATVKDMISGSYDENIFALTDALSAKNKNLATRYLNEQYAAGLSDEYILSMLIRQFKILLQIRAGLEASWSQADLTTKLKLHPFVIKKGLTQARNFELVTLKSLLNQLIGLDKKNKTGQSDIRTELIMLISRL